MEGSQALLISILLVVSWLVSSSLWPLYAPSSIEVPLKLLRLSCGPQGDFAKREVLEEQCPLAQVEVHSKFLCRG